MKFDSVHDKIAKKLSIIEEILDFEDLEKL